MSPDAPPTALTSQPLRRLAAIAALGAALLAGVAPATVHAAPAPELGWQLQGDGPMGMASAWARTTGGPVTVAVLDTGVDATHPDLAGALWTNPGEVAGNGADDDGDGYVDDVHGWDFVHGDGDPADDNGHGTHVAGVIAGRGNDSVGAIGVDRAARIMAVKVLDANGRGGPRRVARGIRFALEHGARIVNLSLATPFPSRALRRALDSAARSDALVVAAAGNWGANLASLPSYPAAYGAANVVSVAATGPSGGLWDGSSYGRRVDLAAPGEAISSTAIGGGYELRTGTSTAAPVVTGVAALVASAHPSAGGRDLRRDLLAGARRTTLPVGYGALDAVGALAAADAPSVHTARRVARIARKHKRRPGGRRLHHRRR